jgi:hypothetical protein
MSIVNPDDFIKITKVLALNYLETPTRQVEMDDVLYLKHNGMYTELGTLSEVKSRTLPGTEFGPAFTNNLYLKRHRTPSLQTLSRNSLRPEHMDFLQTVVMPEHDRSPDTPPDNSKRRKTGNSSLRRARSRNMRIRRSRSRNSRLRRARSRKALRK